MNSTTTTKEVSNNSSLNLHENQCSGDNLHHCHHGVLIPPWNPPVGPKDSATISYRAIVYLLAVTYLIFGVNILSDQMVSAVEVILSQRRPLTTSSGTVVHVKIWNKVVGHLTVYVIGSSAPEIFLPLIEVCMRHFELNELGPALILGSGAYHFFLITAICLVSVKDTNGKPVKEQRVFFVATGFAVLGYLWLYLIADQFSPGYIELWEALLTFAFFPVLVFTAWGAETKLPMRIVRQCMKLSGKVTHGEETGENLQEVGGALAEADRRRRLANLLRDLREANPHKTQSELEEMAELVLLESAPKGAAFYRMQASKAMSGGGDVISKERIKRRLDHEREHKEKEQAKLAKNPFAQIINFDQVSYTVMESCGDAVLTVTRSGAGLEDTSLKLHYRTVEGTAKNVEDFEETSGVLEFKPGQNSLDILVPVVDDDEFEDDKEFFVEIDSPQIIGRPNSNLMIPSYRRNSSNSDILNSPTSSSMSNLKLPRLSAIGLQIKEKTTLTPEIITPRATVHILDDDHCGMFHFENSNLALPDNCGIGKIKVLRSTGARGTIAIPFTLTDGTAKIGEDYIPPVQTSIIFGNDEFEKFIELEIIDKNRIGEMFCFYISLDEPFIMSKPPQNPAGNPGLGPVRMAKVAICEDVELNAALDRLLKVADIAELISSTTWSDQFLEAVHFNSGESQQSEQVDEDEENGGQELDRRPRKISIRFLISLYIYAISLPWKLLAACTPPPKYLHGWLSFFTILLMEAFISTLIGDLATHFGCTVGLRDTVTAVTLIAIGMGLPDTFASRHAAMHEATADASIGHITGSNAVNVFFGIGLAWSIAAIYQYSNNSILKLPPGSFGFGVTLYTAFATIGVVVLLLRRLQPIGGELGGPTIPKYLTASLFILLWLAFVTLIIVESYCVISAGF